MITASGAKNRTPSSSAAIDQTAARPERDQTSMPQAPKRRAAARYKPNNPSESTMLITAMAHAD